jgi:gliding motility-associated-like protein
MSEDGVMNLSLLSGTPPYNYIVEYDNMMIGQSQVNQSIVFNLEELSEGEYYISVTDFNSCFVDSVFYVSEPDEIIADFVPLSDFGRESFSFEAENTSVGGQLYYWDFDNDSTKIASFLQEIKMQFTNQGEYNVMMVAHDTILGHQCNDTIIKVIDVEGYDVYNVFTPNNDGINDVFHFNEWMLNGIYVEIFNRWGQKIYHWDDINSGWEGRAYNGRNVEEGVYFYRLEATGEDGAHFEENGSITLIR